MLLLIIHALGASTAGVTNKFVFTKPDGTDIEISSAKTSFTINSVLLYDTLHLSIRSNRASGFRVIHIYLHRQNSLLPSSFLKRIILRT